MTNKVKIKTTSESSPDTPERVTIKKQEKPKVIPAHLAALLAMKPQETASESPEQQTDAKSFFKQKDRLEADPERSLVAVSWDKKDRLVLEFDDGEELVSPPVPNNANIINSSVVVAGNSGGTTSGVAESFETVSKNLDATDALYAYNLAGDLETVTYASGVIKTLNYTSGVLTSVVLSGTTPSGIDLTKSFTYTSGNLTQVTYS